MEYIKYFKIGCIAIRVITTLDYEVRHPYNLFLTEETYFNETVKIVLCDTLPYCTPNDNVIYHRASFDKNNINVCYGCTIRKDDTHLNVVYLLPIIHNSIGVNTIFTTMSLNKIAAYNNAIILHASMIEFEGKAILFTAPQQTGKSTQADLWEKYNGAFIVNGDKCMVFSDGAEFYASGIPFSGTSCICNNKTLPLRTAVLLSQNKINDIKRLQAANAFFALYRNTVIHLNKPETERLSDTIKDICRCVPIYGLACVPDKTAVDVLYDELKKYK